MFAHLSGQWAKKIKGRLCYFGPWEDWEAALKRYKREHDDLQMGLVPQREDGFTLKQMIDRFLWFQEQRKNSGEVSERTFENYRDIGLLMANTLGRTKLVSSLRPPDFAKMRLALGSNGSPSTLRVKIGYVKAFFAWAHRNEEIERLPKYGDSFAKPSKLAIRKARAVKGKRLLTAEQIRKLIDVAKPRFKAAVLLGINCAFGNSDIAEIRKHHLDLKRAWVDFPRPKTGIERRCPLWPETIKALREAIAQRPDPLAPADDDRVFLTLHGHPLVRFSGKTWADQVGVTFRQHCLDAGFYLPGMGFYWLRHTWRTVADETRDFPACDLIMGHSAGDMASEYRETIADSRLERVSEYVRNWLYAGREGGVE
jgi:integrase